MKIACFLLAACTGAFLFICAGNPAAASARDTHGKAPSNVGIVCWLETSLRRVFPQSPSGTREQLDLLTARNRQISFQVCFRNEGTDAATISCSLDGAEALKPEIRLVGLVPMPHFNTDMPQAEADGVGMLPGLVPDPLYPQTKTTAGPFASRSFWVTLHIPADIAPGEYTYRVRMSWEENKKKQEKILPVRVKISPLVIRPRHDFHVTHWIRGEAISLYYHTDLYSERWWQLARALMKDLYDHGTDVAFVQHFFELRAVFKQPCQLLIVDEPSPGKYRFDWSRVRRYVDMCKKIGFKKFEWAHLWLYWGVENAMHVYAQKDGKYVMLWDENLSATSPVYLNFLKQFLPSFHDFLQQEDILEDSYFHLSDEPGGQHVENYKKARQILHELAPWMKVMDALSDIRYGREHLTDIPVPLIDAAAAYTREHIPHWVYFCTGPRGPWLNRFYDTPLSKIRMSGWLFYHLKAQGFLHWGYNYWYKLDREETEDPYQEGAASSWPGIAYGDPFVVYPGPDGPLSSVRWEVFAESLQDYALLQTAGISPDDSLLSGLHSYADFPKNEAWIQHALEQILNRPATKK
ncbi:DUF4091 domain-containing protein [Compostibacter hankyongensis]